MSEDRSWGADTVAFGRPSREPSRPAPSHARPARPKRPTLALRPVALVTVAIVAVVAFIISAGGGAESQKATKSEISDPAQQVKIQQPPKVRTYEPRGTPKPVVRQESTSQRREGRSKASSATDAQAAAEPAPEYVPPLEQAAPPSPPPPAAPTLPAAEFGL